MNIKTNNFRQIIKSDWKFLICIISFGLLLHLFLWIIWPLHAGADAHTYIYYYLDSFNSSPVYHQLMCFRTPITPFFYGILLSFGGTYVTSIILELMSLSSIFFIYLILIPWGKWPARITSTIFLLMIPFHIQFHQVGSDGIFGYLVIIFCLVFINAIINNKMKYWILLGVVVALLTLTRPAGITFSIAFIAIPFLKLGWKKTFSYILVFLISFGFLISGYIIYKGIRYSDFSISRGFNNTTFYRIFRLQESAIKAENGENTKKFIEIIKNNVLTTDVYRNYNVTINDFLTYKPNGRFTSDSIAIVDIKEGWNTNYKLLFKVSLEAIKADPWSFFKTYLKDFIKINTLKTFLPEIPVKNINLETKQINKINLPTPTEGEMIPFPNHWWLSTRPDGSFPSKNEEKEFIEKADKIIQQYNNEGNLKIGKILDYLWDIFSIPIVYLWILTIAGLLISKGKDRIYLLTIIIIYLIYIAGTLQGTPPWLKYRLPLHSILLISGLLSLYLIFRKVTTNKGEK